VVKRVVTSDTSRLLTGASIGFIIFWLTSNPRSRFKNKLPSRKIKNLHILPNVRIVSSKKTYHFHHWVILIAIYLPLIMKRRFRKSKLLRGLVVGGIAQGLLYKDRFKFRYPTRI